LHSKIMENTLITLTEFIIFAFCLVGCGLMSFYIGRQEGIQGTVQYLIDAGILEVDEENE